ncbi:hypothetical protein EHS25_002110 [Saitozyma podzolica]|uniref:HpcH/HpaI aldolase/citrate lyase domain-containing protein n=1 Tax=Saitozyma podzolica TaxID=1890683 RepID=A0A427YEF8_9TREE|nr:hypothetical protein EHS25_002110 [Saitozyma podzolica]
MQATTYLKNALSRREKCIGFWLTCNAPPLAKTILATGDYTWALIDAEHGQITDADFYVLSNLIASAGASPIIRIPCDSEWMIKRALDAGAHGIMTPMCHNAVSAVPPTQPAL